MQQVVRCAYIRDKVFWQQMWQLLLWACMSDILGTDRGKGRIISILNALKNRTFKKLLIILACTHLQRHQYNQSRAIQSLQYIWLTRLWSMQDTRVPRDNKIKHCTSKAYMWNIFFFLLWQRMSTFFPPEVKVVCIGRENCTAMT